MGVTEDAAPDVADPEVEVVRVGPGVRSTLVRELDRVPGAESIDGGGHPQDARGGVAIRVNAGQTEFDFRVRGLRPDVVRIGVEPAKVGVEHVQLGLDLGVGDVLVRGAVDHVEDHGDGDHCILVGRALLGHDRRPFLGVRFDALDGIGILLKAHHLHMLLVGMTSAGGGRGLGCQAGLLGVEQWADNEQNEEEQTVHEGSLGNQTSYVFLGHLLDHGPAVILEFCNRRQKQNIDGSKKSYLATMAEARRLHTGSFDHVCMICTVHALEWEIRPFIS